MRGIFLKIRINMPFPHESNKTFLMNLSKYYPLFSPKKIFNCKKALFFVSITTPWRWRVTTAMFTPYLNRRTRRSTPTKIESCSCRRSTSPWLITESSVPVSLNRLVSASFSPCDSDPSCNQSLRFYSVFFLVS